MRSEASNVAAYLVGVTVERREALTRLRALCVEVLQGYDECMEYGMPCYKRAGAPEVAFASQKQYIALYVLKSDVVERHRAELGGSVGKGCIRFRNAAAMDFGLIRQMLQETVASNSIPCA
jgi:uncharacterized protein YdhG (YjbR/CyaY superfamily)